MKNCKENIKNYFYIFFLFFSVWTFMQVNSSYASEVVRLIKPSLVALINHSKLESKTLQTILFRIRDFNATERNRNNNGIDNIITYGNFINKNDHQERDNLQTLSLIKERFRLIENSSGLNRANLYLLPNELWSKGKVDVSLLKKIFPEYFQFGSFRANTLSRAGIVSINKKNILISQDKTHLALGDAIAFELHGSSDIQTTSPETNNRVISIFNTSTGERYRMDLVSKEIDSSTIHPANNDLPTLIARRIDSFNKFHQKRLNLAALNLSNSEIEDLFQQKIAPIVEDVSRVVAIDLSGNKLNQVPNWVSKLPALEYINLSYNQIAELPSYLKSSVLVDDSSYPFVDIAHTPLIQHSLASSTSSTSSGPSTSSSASSNSSISSSSISNAVDARPSFNMPADKAREVLEIFRQNRLLIRCFNNLENELNHMNTTEGNPARSTTLLVAGKGIVPGDFGKFCLLFKIPEKDIQVISYSDVGVGFSFGGGSQRDPQEVKDYVCKHRLDQDNFNGVVDTLDELSNLYQEEGLQDNRNDTFFHGKNCFSHNEVLATLRPQYIVGIVFSGQLFRSNYIKSYYVKEKKPSYQELFNRSKEIQKFLVKNNLGMMPIFEYSAGELFRAE